jgi:hypothetical protein
MIALAMMLLAVTATKSAAVVSDPINGTVTPKAIPGARIDYTITINNGTLGALDQDKTVVVDAMPANAKLCLADLGATGSGPVAFSSVLSGLTYSYVGPGNAADDVEFSKDGGATYAYAPTADADGCDPAITHLRLKPKGKFAAGGAASFRFRVMVR